MVENTIRFAIESSDTSGLLLSVRPHVGVLVILVSPRTLLLPSPLSSVLEELFIHVLPSTRYYTPTTESRSLCRSTQCCAVRSLTPQYRRFVVIPISFAEIEAAILRPEEEPYPAEDEENEDEGEKGKEAAIIDMMGIDSARTWLVCCTCLFCYVSCSKV